MKLKDIFTINYNQNILDIWLLLLRVFVGLFMLTHGWPKFQLLISGDEIMFPDPIGLGVKTSFFLIVFAEFICSIFIIIGIGTRLSTIPLIFSMIVASLVFHQADPFSAKELGLIYLLVYSTIFVTGPGKISIDYLLSKKISKK